MKKVFFVLISISVFSLNLNAEVKNTYFPDGSLACEIRYEQGMKNGIEKAYNKSNQLIRTSYYKEGVKNGEEIIYIYYDEISLRKLNYAVTKYSYYIDGKKNGKEVSYAHNKDNNKGCLRFITEYKNGIKHGVDRSYDEKCKTIAYDSVDKNGELIDDLVYENGKIIKGKFFGRELNAAEIHEKNLFNIRMKELILKRPKANLLNTYKQCEID